MELPGPGSVFLHQEWDYPAPAYVGDTVTAEAEVIEARADKPITRLRCVARRERRDRGPPRRVRRLHDAAGVTDRRPSGRRTRDASRWRAAGAIRRRRGGACSAFAPWFSASAVAPLLAAEWHTTGLDLPLLTVAVQLGFARRRAIGLAVTGAADVVAGPRAVRRRRARRPRSRTSASRSSRPDATSALAVAGADRCGPRRGLPDRAADDRRLVPPAIAGSRSGVLIGALTVGSALPHLFRALGASAGATGTRSSPRRASPALGGALVVGSAHRAGPLEVAVAAVQPADRRVGVPRAVGPAGEPRLPRPHVGAVRDVDVAAAVRRGVVRGRRRRGPGGRPARPSFAVVGDRRRRLRRRGRPRRPARPDDADDRGDGRQRRVARSSPGSCSGRRPPSSRSSAWSGA